MKGNFTKYKYFPTALSLYVNYFALGIGLIALAQNMNYLMARYGTDEAGVAFVIAGMGAGRLLIYYFVGRLSDKFGRKLTVFIGLACYIIFFFGVLTAPNIYVAFTFAVIAGIGNAASDTGTYPALMEIFPRATGSAVILCKAAISVGQTLYPLLVAFLITGGYWVGYGFVLPGLVFAASVLILRKLPFPQQNSAMDEDDGCRLTMKRKPTLFDGAVTVLFGTAIYGVFYAFVIWIPKYAAGYAGMELAESLRTVTYYGTGSFIGVILSALLLVRIIRPVLMILILPIIATVTSAVIYLHPTPAVCKIGAFIIGFTAAGGLLQIGVSVLSEFFPGNKARMTGIYMFFGTIANFGVPLVTGFISKVSIRGIILFDTLVGLVSVILGVTVFIRYYMIFEINEQDKRIGETLCRF